MLLVHANVVPRRNVWLYDWHVYHAAAHDLLERTLYRTPLVEPGHPLPLEFFNYPPLAAAWALPLLPFGREPGGIAWLALGIVATSAAALLGARACGLGWLWAAIVAGAALVPYSTFGHFGADVLLGNNNHLMFGLVGGFALAHVRGHERLAGGLLGVAIGTKLWPIALAVLLLRERRWRELRWAAGAIAVHALLAVAWLGPDVIGPMVPAIAGQNLQRGEPRPELVIWTSYARVVWDWWPAWGGYAMAAALVVLPATGRLGVGLGIVGGLSLNNYLWHHYLPVLILGLVLIGAGVAESVVRRGRARDPRAPARDAREARAPARDPRAPAHGGPSP